MPPTGAKPFPPSKKIQALDTEAKGRGRYEDGSLGPKKSPGANEPNTESRTYTASPSYQVPGTKANEKAGPRARYGIGQGVLSRKKTLNPVSDKRTVKQKLMDAQSRGNGGR